MDNNLENKRNFFSLYYGQIVAIVTKGSYTHPIDTVHVMDENVLRSTNSIVKHRYSAYLKPLSSITDEDSLICYRIHFKGHLNKDIRPEESRITFTKKHIIHPIEVCILEVTDYLRSKGYAIPYMGLSVETMLDYGWIKLKEDASI